MKSIAGKRNADGLGGIGARPGGSCGVIPGDVVPGCIPAYGFVKNEASEVIESIGSRSNGFFPLEFRFGGVESLCDPPLPLRVRRLMVSSRGDNGVGVADAEPFCAAADEIGGLLWKRQNMW